MCIIKKYFNCIWMLFVPMFAMAQPADSLQPFYFMDGVWKGTGWIINDQKKQYFRETETVVIKLNGSLIQLEAFGVSVDDSTNIVNNALGLLHYNKDKNRHELSIYQPQGSFAVAVVKLLKPNELEWRLTLPGSQHIKYIIKVSGNLWYEAGYFSKDGVQWVQTFEMELKKAGD